MGSYVEQVSSALSLGVFGAATIIPLAGKQKLLGDKLFSTPVKRGVWYGAVGAIVGASSFHTQEAIKEVDGHISSLNSLLSAGNEEAPSVTTLSTNQSYHSEVSADFEDYAAIDYDDIEPTSNLVCKNGGDGKGSCIKLSALKSDLTEMNLGEVAGVSNQVEDMANELMRKDGSLNNGLKLAKEIAGKKSLVKKAFDQVKAQMFKSKWL